LSGVCHVPSHPAGHMEGEYKLAWFDVTTYGCWLCYSLLMQFKKPCYVLDLYRLVLLSKVQVFVWLIMGLIHFLIFVLCWICYRVHDLLV
jgi:hypothetical protein